MFDDVRKQISPVSVKDKILHILIFYTLFQALDCLLTLTRCVTSVPPMFWIPSQREAVYLGQASVTVECHSEAFPKSINYWVNSKGAMLQSSE